MFRNSETGELENGIAAARPVHEAIIDELLVNPLVTQNELAVRFQRSPSWISIVMNCDAFQARWAERRGQTVDPLIQTHVETRLKAVAQRSLDKLLEKLDASPSDELVLKAAELGTRALGYGAKTPQAGQNNQFVVVIPPQQAAGDWEAAHRPADVGGVSSLDRGVCSPRPPIEVPAKAVSPVPPAPPDLFEGLR